eukprot:3532063-Pyramimonas_sp.AAC.1
MKGVHRADLNRRTIVHGRKHADITLLRRSFDMIWFGIGDCRRTGSAGVHLRSISYWYPKCSPTGSLSNAKYASCSSTGEATTQ